MIFSFTSSYSCAVSLVLTLGVTNMCSFVRTLGIPNGLSKRSLQSSSPLHTSIWEADLTFDLQGDNYSKVEIGKNTNGLVQHKQAKQIEIIKYKQQRPTNASWCPFYFYLHQQQRSIRNPSSKALHMDDELKRMESRYYQLGGENLPRIYFPLGHGFDHYNGDLVRPNEEAYELILRAYSKAKLSEEGIEFAEDVIARYEKYNTSKRATTKMMAFIMKACIAAGNLEQTQHWLHQIEKRYEVTRLASDFPGYYIYNPFVIGLKRMTNISPRKAAKLSMEILHKIDLLFDSAEKYNFFPGSDLYLEIMKYQEHGYRGTAAFFRIEKVFRQLQKNYRSTGNHPRLKPSVEALTPVFTSASKCYFPHDDRVCYQVNELFDEFDQIYKETGDPDFCPNVSICNALNSIYARMNRHKMNLTDFTERTMLLMQRMEEYNVKFKDPRDKTSAFNRILHAAESQLPDDPMSDPLTTRELFMVLLEIFKKFHDDNAQMVLSPNKATYQIFLRACSKLPEGEARSKLAAKAFQLCQQNGSVTIDTVVKLHEANPEYALSMLNSTNYLGFESDLFSF